MFEEPVYVEAQYEYAEESKSAEAEECDELAKLIKSNQFFMCEELYGASSFINFTLVQFTVKLLRSTQ